MQHLLHTSLLVYAQIRDELRHVLDASRSIDERYSKFAATQLHYYSERCQSLNVLLQQGKLWDCDIIMRAALECATRFIFVSIATSDERYRRIEEYTIELNEIEDLLRSEKAKAAIASSTDADTIMLVGGVILTPEREAELRARWPKAKRAALKQKWSFSEIVRELTNFQAGQLDLRKYKSFLHGYGISSHLIHADQTAMNLVWDRVRREPNERNTLERAHFARLSTDPVSVLFLCWRAMVFATGVDCRNSEIVCNLLHLHEEANVFHRAFAESQAHVYQHG
ncbi:DUF5677 domain-containing protein [Methylogaea oryzae]|uniref:Uncharacterized protein n=1 Tax=Methylogaea oryzae TaxID=1295382 RepID=A0A8D4VS25_9GAMM|nr:DUF5677 domain-containing protein [Methylogaea oryzae]BBL71547.1 hypothetical protein MoryE10_21530 [Methylogaea oryzae]